MQDTIEKELIRPDAYPEPTIAVELIQTHISYVFITDKFVYKIKKSVNFGFLDFTTLEKRKYYCEQEITLNRRLSPEIYLDIVPVTEIGGRLFIGRKGHLVDYAVKMKKIPMCNLMAKLLKDNKVTGTMVVKVARKIAKFHESAATSKAISKFGNLDTIKQNTDENFQQTGKYIGLTITEDQYNLIKMYTDDFFKTQKNVIKDRIRENRIKDCHGDIHMEHICLSKQIIIFDCIEFNDRFRYSDTAADIAFLAMDLEYNGRSDLSKILVDSYMKYSRDRKLLKVLDFYKVYRAYVRGKVISFLLDDKSISESDRDIAMQKAKRYFALAYSIVRKHTQPNLLLVCGLMGTGKSSLAKILAEKDGYYIITSDKVRKDLAEIALNVHKYEKYQGGIYSPKFTSKVYDRMFRIAEERLSNHESVIIDASFNKKAYRTVARKVASSNSASFKCIELVSTDDIVRQRLEKRYREDMDVSDGRWEIFHMQKSEFEKITELPKSKYIVIDNSEDLESALNEVEKSLTPEFF